MKKTFLLLILWVTAYAVQAQSSKKITTIKQLTDSIEVLMKREHIPGLMLGITTKDSVLFSGGLGLANIEEKRPVDAYQLYRLGSITKMFVALGIMQLQQEGKLNINDELKKIAPEIPFKNDWEAQSPVRIVNLLEHTTGFDDIKLNNFFNIRPKDNAGLEAVLVHKNSLVTRWRPGERFAYSNPNYAILGYIIEKISKQPYDKYLTENILTPLGMTHSNFNLHKTDPKQEAQEYVYRDGKLIKIPTLSCSSGAFGTFRSCSADMIQFLQLFLHNGKPLFSESFIEEMEKTYQSLGVKAGLKSGYGLGNYQSHFYNKFIFHGHDGMVGSTYSNCMYNRELGVGYIMANSSNNPMWPIQRLIDTFLGENFTMKPIKTMALDEKAIEPYLGFYQFDSPRNAIAGFLDQLTTGARLYIKNDTLYNQTLMMEETALLPVAPLIFVKKGMSVPTIAFTVNREGKRVKIDMGAYFEKSSLGMAILYRLALFVSVVFMLFAVIFSVFSLVKAFMKKISFQQLLVRLLPVLALGALIWAVLNVMEVKTYIYLMPELSTITLRSVTIFVGTLLFALLSLLTLGIAIQQFRRTKSRWFAWYYLLTAFSLCFVMIILWQSDWIGLRTWAM